MGMVLLQYKIQRKHRRHEHEVRSRCCSESYQRTLSTIKDGKGAKYMRWRVRRSFWLRMEKRSWHPLFSTVFSMQTLRQSRIFCWGEGRWPPPAHFQTKVNHRPLLSPCSCRMLGRVICVKSPYSNERAVNGLRIAIPDKPGTTDRHKCKICVEANLRLAPIPNR